MANHCSNYIDISGEKTNIDTIENALRLITQRGEFLNTETFAETLGIEPPDGGFGTKWFSFYSERTGDDNLVLSGDSAWSPPTLWIQMLSEKFNVAIESEYEECGMDFAGYFNVENGVVTKDVMTDWFTWRLNEDRWSAIENLMFDYGSFEEFMKNTEEERKQLTDDEIAKIETEYKFNA